VVADERKRVFLPEQNLVGEGDRFEDWGQALQS
jgi:hypothetical protein